VQSKVKKKKKTKIKHYINRALINYNMIQQ